MAALRLFAQECLCINQIKANNKAGDTIACLVHKGEQDARALKEQHFEEYELKHPAEYPSKIIYVYLNGYRPNDNFQSLYEWVERKLDSGEINVDDPGPYEFNQLEA